MYKTQLFLVSLIFLLASCGAIGNKKTKNLTELTPKLKCEKIESLKIQDHNIPNHSILSFKKEYKSISMHPIISKPLIQNDVLYTVNSKGVISAFNFKTSTHLWDTPLTGDTNEYYSAGGITYQNNILYVTCGSRYMILIDTKNGHELMRKEFPDLIRARPIFLNDNVILVQTISNQLFAYDITSKRILWDNEDIQENITESDYISPIIIQDKVLVVYNSGRMMILDAKTGQVKLNLNIAKENDIAIPNFESTSLTTQPIIEDQYIYVASATGKLSKFDINQERYVWQVDAYDIQSMFMYGNNLFIINNGKQIAIINKLNGKIIWLSTLEDKKDKKNKPVAFFAPFLTKTESGVVLNAVTTQGVIYSFYYDNDISNFSTIPKILEIKKNINFIEILPNNIGYFLTKGHLIMLGM